MKGLGMFTGRVYTEEQRHKAEECCHVITDQQAEDTSWLKVQHVNDLCHCLFCNGCPESQKSKV